MFLNKKGRTNWRPRSTPNTPKRIVANAGFSVGLVRLCASPRSCLFVKGFAAYIFILSSTLCAAAGPETVTQSFAQAQQAIRLGKTREAIKILSWTLSRYPAHQPSRLLLGHLFFSRGQWSKAGKQFRRVDPDLLGGDLAYEYGVTMFATKDCRRAVRGLSHVPMGPLTDLAAFYSGICFMRLGDFTRAETYLGKAEQLPEHLAGPRRQALDHIRQLSAAERRGQPIGPTPYIMVPPPVPEPLLPPGTSPPANKPPPAPPPPVGLTYSATPSMTVTRTSTGINYFGYKRDDNQSLETNIKAAAQAKYTFSALASGGQPYVSLALSGAEKFVDSTSSSVAFNAYSNDPQSLRGDETVTPTASKTAEVSANPELSVPLFGFGDLAGGVKYTETIPDLTRYKRSTASGPYANVSLGKTFTLKGKGSQMTTVDLLAMTTKVDTTFGGEIARAGDVVSLQATYEATQTTFTQKAPPPAATTPSPSGSTNAPPALQTVTLANFEGQTQVIAAQVKKNWALFTLSAGAKETLYALADPATYVKLGEDSSLRLEVSGVRTLEFGGNITVTLATTQFDAYKASVDSVASQTGDTGGTSAAGGGKTLVKAAGTRQEGLISFKVAPVEWIYGVVSYKATQQSFSGIDGKLEQNFEKTTAESTSEFKFEVGISKTLQ